MQSFLEPEDGNVFYIIPAKFHSDSQIFVNRHEFERIWSQFNETCDTVCGACIRETSWPLECQFAWLDKPRCVDLYQVAWDLFVGHLLRVRWFKRDDVLDVEHTNPKQTIQIIDDYINKYHLLEVPFQIVSVTDHELSRLHFGLTLDDLFSFSKPQFEEIIFQHSYNDLKATVFRRLIGFGTTHTVKFKPTAKWVQHRYELKEQETLLKKQAETKEWKRLDTIRDRLVKLATHVPVAEPNVPVWKPKSKWRSNTTIAATSN